MIRVVGYIKFKNIIIDVYYSLDEPLFKAYDVAKILEYGEENVHCLIECCEEDEKQELQIVSADQKIKTMFITERGLYNVLSHSHKPVARAWRRIIANDLINLRKSKGKNIVERFEEWDKKIKNIYFDDQTGIMIEPITLQRMDCFAKIKINNTLRRFLKC